MQSSTDFERLFDSAPISLWLEDYSALRALFARWRSEGVSDLAAHLRQQPALAAQCAQCYRVLRVNRETLRIFGASDQATLIARMDEVFRGEMFERMVAELDQLWRGVLDFSCPSVNYTLDGRRLDVQVHVRVLEGYEDSWERVMVSLQDVSAQTQAQRQLEQSERYARDLFALSPVSLWVEDFSDIKLLLEQVRNSGITDFKVFLDVHGEFIQRCMDRIRVLDVNQETLRMFGASSREELFSQIDTIFRDEMKKSFTEQLIDLWHGHLVQTREVINYRITGELLYIHLQFAVMPGHEARWDRVLVSLIDISARKKAEAYLEYLGNHDPQTKLRNRAFYGEELNRISRKGPWPLSVLALDMNGLKVVNDTQGHAAGDELLRRVGEVLQKASANLPICMARIGGDEFIALMPGADARAVAALQEQIESHLELNNQFYPGQKLSLSMGQATCFGPGEVEACLQQADERMYANKRRHYESTTLDRRRHDAS